MEYVLLACDGLYDVLSNDEINYAVQSAVGKRQPSSVVRLNCIGDAMEHYMQGDVTNGDSSLT